MAVVVVVIVARLTLKLSTAEARALECAFAAPFVGNCNEATPFACAFAFVFALALFAAVGQVGSCERTVTCVGCTRAGDVAELRSE